MKKHRDIYILLTASLIIYTGCSTVQPDRNVVEYGNFNKEFSIKPKVVDWLDIWNCYDMRIYDSILVAVDWKRDKIFRVYNINSKKFIGSFGNIGKGPGEFFNTPRITSASSYNKGKLIFQVYDRGRSNIQNIDLFSSISEGNIITTNVYDLPQGISGKKPFVTQDGRFYGAGSSVLQVYNPADEEISKSHDPIQFTQNLPEMYERIARIMYIEKAPYLNRIVGTFNVLRRIHIYSSDGDLIRVIKEIGDPSFDTSNREFYVGNKTHFSKSFLTDENILVLDEDRIERTTGGYLLFFDYEGNALIKYKLDRYIHIGAFDCVANIFYAADYETGSMISYDLAEAAK